MEKKAMTTSKVKLVCFLVIALSVQAFAIHLAWTWFTTDPPAPTAPIEHNALFDEDTNVAIIELIESHLRAFYGSYDRSLMEKLYSDDLLHRRGEQIASRQGGRLFRRVDRTYMQTLWQSSENEMGESFFRVRVRVYGGLLDEWRRIHHLLIKRDAHGSYTITYMEFDR